MKVIEPVGISITVVREEGQKVTESGLVLPDSMINARKHRCVIVSFGDGMCPDGKKIDMPYQIGDVVIVPPHAGVELEAEGYDKSNPLMLITHNDVFCFERDSNDPKLDLGRISVPGV